MDLGTELDDLIQLHANYHSGKQGLNDKAFKELLLQLIEAKIKKG